MRTWSRSLVAALMLVAGMGVGSVDSTMAADGKVFMQAVKSASGTVTSTLVFDRQ